MYEPVVTLYNPYDTALSLNIVRIKIWDPPVGFRFKKNADYLRSEWGSGIYHGLGRFQIANENNANAGKTFTLRLQNYVSGGSASSIVIPPGGTKTFSAYVEPSWTWGVETSGGYTPRSLYDWDLSRDFTNKDSDTNNQFGVECSPGWTFRAGFQSDHLSISSGRPSATLYPFETNSASASSGWVAIKLTDSVTVETRAQRTAPLSSDSDFRVDLLAGTIANADQDIYRSYKFSIAPLVQPNGGTSGIPAVSHTYLAGDLLQSPNDATPGGKHPFAVFTMVANTKALLNGSLEKVTTLAAGEANKLYDLRFDEMNSYSQFPEPGPFAASPSDTSILSTRIKGNTMTVDLIGPAFAAPLSVEGGRTPMAFPDNLTSAAVFSEGPDGTGIRKVSIDISGKGPSYFLRMKK